nr:IclR family transcriptional regulator C-terminal domain-containing protein [Kineosporia babensis]
MVTDVGTRLPAHLTAVGRSSLSYPDADTLMSMYRGYGCSRRTEVTVSSLADRLPLLDDARPRGT